MEDSLTMYSQGFCSHSARLACSISRLRTVRHNLVSLILIAIVQKGIAWGNHTTIELEKFIAARLQSSYMATVPIGSQIVELLLSFCHDVTQLLRNTRSYQRQCL